MNTLLQHRRNVVVKTRIIGLSSNQPVHTSVRRFATRRHAYYIDRNGFDFLCTGLFGCADILVRVL